MDRIGLEIYLLFSAVMMCFLIAVQMKWYNIAAWKSIFVSLAIIITGLLCCEIWFYMENGIWGGRSFFGAIFFAPVTFILVAKLLNIPYVYSLDYCATSGCLVLAILKIDCLVNGCCKGIVIFENKKHEVFRFPSQLVEIITALMLTLILLHMSRKPENRGKIYPVTLVAYGAIRFILNLLRDDWHRMRDMGLFLPLGCIWSIVAVIIGMFWLWFLKRKTNLQRCVCFRSFNRD